MYALCSVTITEWQGSRAGDATLDARNDDANVEFVEPMMAVVLLYMRCDHFSIK